MGGVVGVLSIKDSMKLDDRHEIGEKMLDAISHRAPCHHMDFSYKDVLFGARYHQRKNRNDKIAHDEVKKVMIIIDGDIFHYNSDTTLDEQNDAKRLLNLYLKKGEKFVDEIDGVFSIAVWDAFKNKLILIRDRIGCKPLFFYASNQSIVFASEIKSIIKSGLYSKSVSLFALNQFLSYWYVPNPDTLFESITQVRPGHMIIYQYGKITEKKYYKFKYKKIDKNRTEEEYTHQFFEIFKSAVQRRLNKYPDSGAFLSGGLDSSSVAVMMSNLRNASIKVFSAGFKDKQFNEIEDAKAVSDHMGAELYSTIIDFDQDFGSLLEKIVWYHDAPFADTSAIPSYFASKLAKVHVDVVFTGDFPDQLIGGSGHHANALHRSKNQSWIQTVLKNKSIKSVIRQLPITAGGTSFFDKLKRYVYRETFPIEEQRVLNNMPVPELLKRSLYSSDMLSINKKHPPLLYAQELYSEVKESNLLDKLLYFDIMSYAPDDLMVKVDRMTAAHGLIAISPFHDLEVLEFVAQLPAKYKIKGQDRKYIMREAMRPMLPIHTLEKPKKGFDMPIDKWLIQKDPAFVTDVLLDSKTLNRGYFNKNFLKKMVGDYLEGKTDYASGNSATIISLLTLELWHRLFID